MPWLIVRGQERLKDVRTILSVEMPGPIVDDLPEQSDCHRVGVWIAISPPPFTAVRCVTERSTQTSRVGLDSRARDRIRSRNSGRHERSRSAIWHAQRVLFGVADARHIRGLPRAPVARWEPHGFHQGSRFAGGPSASSSSVRIFEPQGDPTATRRRKRSLAEVGAEKLGTYFESRGDERGSDFRASESPLLPAARLRAHPPNRSARSSDTACQPKVLQKLADE